MLDSAMQRAGNVSRKQVICPTVAEEADALVALAEETGFFKQLEIEALREVFADYFDSNRSQGHRCVTLQESGVLLGFAYFAPAAMTTGTWHLWWIAVARQYQRCGWGTQLLQHVEEAIRSASGRHLLVETSSTQVYAPTRHFYLRHGYTVVACVPDYYAAGDDLVIFRKILSGPSENSLQPA